MAALRYNVISIMFRQVDFVIKLLLSSILIQVLKLLSLRGWMQFLITYARVHAIMN
jgi:hypothetical protein